MGEIRMTGEIRTDYDCEVSGLPSERWGEAAFQIGDEEIGDVPRFSVLVVKGRSIEASGNLQYIHESLLTD